MPSPDLRRPPTPSDPAQLCEPTDALSLSLLLRMTRPGFLLLTVAACLLGFAWSSTISGQLHALTASVTVMLALIAHAGANVLNDYHDALNGADAANQQGLAPFSGGARLIQQGKVSVRATGSWAAALLWLLVPAGIGLALYSGSGLLTIGMLGLLLAWGYSAPPLALMSRGLGELAVGVAWWLVVVGTCYVQCGHWQLAPGLSSVGFGLLAMNVLLINGLPDAPADASVGKRTLVVRLGARRAAWLYLLLALLAHAWPLLSVYMHWAPPSILWALLTLPLALSAALLLQRHALQPQRLRPAIVLTIASAVGYALAMALGLLAGAHA